MSEDAYRKLRTLRGFLVYRPADASNVKQWYSNPVVEDIYRQFHNEPELAESWEFQRKTLFALADIYRSSPAFIFNNLIERDSVSPRAIDFLKSTVDFINTGRRRVIAELWMDMLPVYPEQLRLQTVDELRLNAEYGKGFGGPIENTIAAWVSHRGGFADLIISSAVFFGGELNQG